MSVVTPAVQERHPVLSPARAPAAIRAWGSAPLVRNALSLLGSTLVTSGLGFVFWAVAARLYPPAAVGAGSAAVSAMTLLATVGMLGWGTFLIGQLNDRSTAAPPPGRLIAAVLLVAGALSALLGLSFATVGPAVSAGAAGMIGGPLAAAVFVVGVTLTAVTLVLDQAFVGLLLGGLQLWRNSYFSLLKALILVPVAALPVGGALAGGGGILLAWVVGTVLSCLVLVPHLRRRGLRATQRPDLGLLRGRYLTTLEHSWVNLAGNGSRLILPLVVVFAISAQANAAFYAAWMIVMLLAVVPGHLTTALFAVTAGDSAALRSKIRFTLRLSALVGLVGMVLLSVLARPALEIFGAHYAAQAVLCLQILVLAYPGGMVKQHFTAVARVEGWLRRCAVVLTAGTALELVGAYLGAQAWGLSGLAAGFVTATCIQALAMLPPVLAAAGWLPRSYRGLKYGSSASAR